MNNLTPQGSITDADLRHLVDLIKQGHSFDFSDYSKASLKRRFSRIMMLKKLSVAELEHQLLNDTNFFQWFLEEITVNVTEMFRDPGFYKVLNNYVIPSLAKYPAIRIWSAGCSSGEEVYSIAILLNHHYLGEKSFVYGTDVNTEMLNEARKGTYTLRKLNNYLANYIAADMPGALTDHFNMMQDVAAIQPDFRKNTSFTVHNLVSDAPFNEFQMISCRNVFIYFEAHLQEKVLDLFYRSLSPSGFLCLGSKESIRFPDFKNRFKVINSRENIYQKIGE